MDTDQLHAWARIGAALRLSALEAERAAIFRAIPELRRVGAAHVANGRPRRTFSAAAKRRMSAGMRKYWARRKAAAMKLAPKRKKVIAA